MREIGYLRKVACQAEVPGLLAMSDDAENPLVKDKEGI